jgi:hypothetical protein
MARRRESALGQFCLGKGRPSLAFASLRLDPYLPFAGEPWDGPLLLPLGAQPSLQAGCRVEKILRFLLSELITS